MYVSLGLLWLSFKIIYGEITSCPLGGSISFFQCVELNQECVLNKFYIKSFEKKIFVNKKNKCEQFDTPYHEFQSNHISSAKNEIYHYTIFKKSLILDETVPIEQLWNDALETGTDTYRIKFHNKLINRYHKHKKDKTFANFLENIMGRKNILKYTVKPLNIGHSVTDILSVIWRCMLLRVGGKKNLLEEYNEYMILIQSYYTAASIYYFSKNYQFAYEVVTEGLSFFKSINSKLYSRSYNKIQQKHVDIWNLLLLTLKLDIMNIFNDKDKDTGETLNAILTEEKKYIAIDIEIPFPSSAVLLFRRYFLDDKHSIKKQQLENWLNTKTLWKDLDDDILYRKHISMYKFLVFFTITLEYKDKLSTILKAIERPVLSIEDRLLNYKATQLALQLVKPCIDSSDTSDYKDMCDKFKNYENSNTGFESTIITKLYILYYSINTDLKDKLLIELTTDNHIIEQNVLHLIVTAVLDIDIYSYNHKRNISIVKFAIELLKAYTKYHEKNLKNIKEGGQLQIEKKKSNVTAKKTRENKTEKTDFKTTNYDMITSTKYTKNEIINNLFIAYKWLMELFGVQSNNSLFYLNTPKCIKAQNNANRMAFEENELLHSNQLINDEHFMYLKAKQKSKMLLSSDNWEPSNRPGGWVQNITSKTTLKYFNPTKATEYDILEQLIYLKDNSKCPYINRIEIFTIIFRYFWKLKQDYVAMYTSIKSAITEIVVTSEDRLRNFEAHELFTMYLMERNEVGIKLANVLDIDQVYYTFLINPELRYENNITYQDFWDDEDGNDNTHRH